MHGRHQHDDRLLLASWNRGVRGGVRAARELAPQGGTIAAPAQRRYPDTRLWGALLRAGLGKEGGGARKRGALGDQADSHLQSRSPRRETTVRWLICTARVVVRGCWGTVQRG